MLKMCPLLFLEYIFKQVASYETSYRRLSCSLIACLESFDTHLEVIFSLSKVKKSKVSLDIKSKI